MRIYPTRDGHIRAAALALALSTSPFSRAAAATTINTVASVSAAQSTSPLGSAAWEVDDTTAALTGATTTAAVLQSIHPLINMIGAPETASLILRCSDGAMAMFVSWPQVLNHDSDGLDAGPQTMVLWRLDAAPIAVNFWDLSGNQTAAGKFTTKGALKLMMQLAAAKRLVVRMSSSQSTQDAEFDLTEIAPALARVEHTCGAAH